MRYVGARQSPAEWSGGGVGGVVASLGSGALSKWAMSFHRNKSTSFPLFSLCLQLHLAPVQLGSIQLGRYS